MADHKEESKIRWNESTMNDIHANVCTVAGSREEIYLLFGTEQPDHPADQEESIQLTDRIILSPSTAKQLALALEKIVRDTESDGEEKSAALFRLVKELNVEIGLEYSFKILEKSLFKNRFLLGVNKRLIEDHAHERIIHICRQLDMPQSLLETFRNCLLDANYVHFGFEENKNTCLYKVYVEFWDSIREKIRSRKDFSQPFLLHLGFKWDAFDNDRKSVTRYSWHPWLSIPDILARLGAVLDPVTHRPIYKTAESLVAMAAERIPHQDILYLEVTEDGNPRRSFDINVYRAGLQVGELYPLLAKLGEHYAVSHGEFHHLYDQIRTKRFGHISGGMGREGTDFCTIYYGVEPVYGTRLRQAQRTGESLIAPGSDLEPMQGPAYQSVEKTDKEAGRLLELVKGLRVPFAFERSFKMKEKTFLPDRFLTGFLRREVAPEQQEEILDLCRQIQMPEDFLGSFREDFLEANIVLFGFESNGAKRYYKVYLEFSDRLKGAVEDPHPFPMFTGFKWDVSDNSSKVVTRYTCFPSFVLKDMADRAARLFYQKGNENSYRIMEGIMNLAANRVGPNEFLYFEADEATTERSSFSINLYRANLRVAELYPLLLEMVRHYSVPKEQFNRVYETAKTEIVGHLAGGIDREGKDFLTLYFSDKGSSGRSRTGKSPYGQNGRWKYGPQQD